MQIVNVSREFVVKLDVARAIKLKDLGLLDILAIPDDTKPLQLVLSDPFVFSRVLWESTDQTGLTLEAFRALLQPGDLDEFAEAFTREVILFFPPPIREVFETQINAALKQTIGKRYGDWPASSESTLETSEEPYENSTTWCGAGNELNGNALPI